MATLSVCMRRLVWLDDWMAHAWAGPQERGVPCFAAVVARWLCLLCSTLALALDLGAARVRVDGWTDWADWSFLSLTRPLSHSMTPHALLIRFPGSPCYSAITPSSHPIQPSHPCPCLSSRPPTARVYNWSAIPSPCHFVSSPRALPFHPFNFQHAARPTLATQPVSQPGAQSPIRVIQSPSHLHLPPHLHHSPPPCTHAHNNQSRPTPTVPSNVCITPLVLGAALYRYRG